jgi:hypothetical protein
MVHNDGRRAGDIFLPGLNPLGRRALEKMEKNFLLHFV